MGVRRGKNKELEYFGEGDFFALIKLNEDQHKLEKFKK